MKLKIEFLLIVCFVFIVSCETLQVQSESKGISTVSHKLVKTVEAYKDAGNEWGKRHLTQGLKPEQIDPAFVKALIDSNDLDYFWVHSDLKNAFQKGYRIGYTERTSDLVLGPHLTEAAGQIGFNHL